ncbi:site-specific integrase [cf. Phormidesmis sp. LEGE 11477]|uniref:site-specific integrase n=1 Tax=cf. Phormidesmis sp. LEGE 11477 TaxID=1828680 RepID=UPI001883023E|nr:site-specific integrase [cf. Phormidesmis sp. LEGE 11477]MBE9063065.1 site-specific integrase [cf. Phormidesmis sp. LEGE 11477]
MPETFPSAEIATKAVQHAIDTPLAKVNQRFKAAKLGLKIERRGDKLNLRGTLPPRPNSPRLRAYQQRIPLSLPANKSGLKQIEKTAKVIAAQLIENTFNWQDYLGPMAGLKRSGVNLATQIAAFEVYFFQSRSGTAKPSSLRTTWGKAYVPYFNKLQAIAAQHPNYSLPEAIYATVQSTTANSRSRQICCTALDALAAFLNIPLPIELKAYWGNYGNSKTQLRALPTDAEILRTYEKIKNPAWQFVYGVMATYGLRNHEVFFSDYSMLTNGDEEAAIEVLESTKTGQHDVWPFHHEWVDAFNLREVRLPKVNTDLNSTTLQLVGQLVSKQFKRYDIPFSPYDLRHAWAVRTIGVGLPDTVSARMMGHSVAVHNRTYHRWITRRDQRAAVKAAMARG